MRLGNFGMNKLFGEAYKDKKVLITGHTGFKGSWLALWLVKMGAKVIGYSLKPSANPNHYDLLTLKEKITSIIGNINDGKKLNEVFNRYQPDIVFHLAAQPLVRYSYINPIETYETNVLGTLKVFEASRNAQSVKVIINITSDKCYENKEWIWGYRENDALGGYDLYSSSKACSELLTGSYRNSFLNVNSYKKNHDILLASCRAGNVIGGGDWAKDRLIADVMISASKSKKTLIRNPDAVRPWQHVLEPLSGYLLLGQKLLEGRKEFAESWNFGPDNNSAITVEEVVDNLKQYWNKINYKILKEVSGKNEDKIKDKNQNKDFHEAAFLKLDCSKVHLLLEWKQVWNINETFKNTVDWYKYFYENNLIKTEDDLMRYINSAKDKKLSWTK